MHRLSTGQAGLDGFCYRLRAGHVAAAKGLSAYYVQQACSAMLVPCVGVTGTEAHARPTCGTARAREQK